MKFGIKAGEDTSPVNESNANQGSFIRYFKDKSTTLRFLEEADDWTKVWMHFNHTKNRDYPCTDDFSTCPGHNSPNEKERKPSLRYITNALNVETGFVDLYKIPMSIKEDIDRNADKYGTLMDRDYTVYRKQAPGQAPDYTIEREDPQTLDLTPYLALKKDHQEALNDAFRDVWGGTPEEPEYTGGDFIADNQDVVYEAPRRSVYDRQPKGEPEALWSRGPGSRAAEPEPSWSVAGSQVSLKEAFPEDPPFKPAVQQDEEQRELTVPQLRAMTEEDVLGVFKIAAVPIPDSYKDKDELVDVLVAALS